MEYHKEQKPELVCPAGDWASLVTAVNSGADSVYFGVKGVNMRNMADNFDLAELSKVMDFLHSRDKKGYLALNVVVLNRDIDKVKRVLNRAVLAGVDAVVAWDMAVLSAARELGLRIHVSTQASVANSKAAAVFAALGAQRIVLARECGLKEIKQIAEDMERGDVHCEIEAFIHGAMCVSVSGRCFLSQYSYSKSANKGECLQPCRREFLIKDSQDGAEYLLGRDYVLSSQDLCSIDFIDRLIRAKIRAFKIEGRMRSVEYVRVVVASYREAIDAFFDGNLTSDLKIELKNRLKSVFNRGFCSGFYFSPPESNSTGLGNTGEKVFLGEVEKFFGKINVAEVILRNGSLSLGQKLMVTGKKTPADFFIVRELQQNHVFVNNAGKGEKVGVKMPFRAKAGDKVFLWKDKNDGIA